MSKQRITLFQAIDIVFDEVGARIGEPSPKFWIALRKIWGFILAFSALLMAADEKHILELPPALEKVNGYLIFVAGSSFAQTFFAKKDTPPPG